MEIVQFKWKFVIFYKCLIISGFSILCLLFFSAKILSHELTIGSDYLKLKTLHHGL